MNNYQEKYIKILDDIKELERKQEELILLLKTKEEEKKTLEEKCNNLTQELENQKKEKNKILKVDYDDCISILKKIYLFTIIMFFILHYKTYGIAASGLDKVIYYVILCGGTLLLCGLELKITVKYINKRNKKILNSSEYKNLLERITTNEIELENITKKQDELTKEHLNTTINYSTISASLKIKKEILEDFKNEVFGILVGNLTEMEDKPLARIRTREILNNKS